MSEINETARLGQLRRIPKQDRSRDRIDEILKASMDLIGRKGIDAVTMKEIASLSGGPIASVYQYFPNKSAIVATLYERYADEVKNLVETGFAAITSTEEALAAVEKLIDAYYYMVNNAPAIQDLLNAAQADKNLAALDLEQSRVHSLIFVEATRDLVPEELRDEFVRIVLLMFHLAAGVVRLALLVDEEEASWMIRDFKTVAKVQFQQFVGEIVRGAESPQAS